MGIFGGKCVRCGKSLPNDRTGAARTCADCTQHLHGKLEPERRCPKDGTKMTLETVWNILVERCPVCHSVWLDGGDITSPGDTSGVVGTAGFVGELVA